MQSPSSPALDWLPALDRRSKFARARTQINVTTYNNRLGHVCELREMPRRTYVFKSNTPPTPGARNCFDTSTSTHRRTHAFRHQVACARACTTTGGEFKSRAHSVRKNRPSRRSWGHARTGGWGVKASPCVSVHMSMIGSYHLKY